MLKYTVDLKKIRKDQLLQFSVEEETLWGFDITEHFESVDS